MLPEIIIIGAGVRNARKINNHYQMFLEIDGRTNCEIILDEVTRIDGGRPIYIWGSDEHLRELLSPVIEKEKNNREIVLVPEKGNLVESLVFTYLEYLKRRDQDFRKLSSGWNSFGDIDWELLAELADREAFGPAVFYMTCDIPLVTKEEIEFLIRSHRREYDLHMGWSRREGFDEVLGSLRSSGIQFDYGKSKMNFSRFMSFDQPLEARFNNFFCGRPLRLDQNLYTFIQALYESRNLIKKKTRGGREQKNLNTLRFLKVLSAFSKYLEARRKRIGMKVFSCGHFLLNNHFHSLGLKGNNYRLLRSLVWLLGRIERRRPEEYMDLAQIERNVETLTGQKIGFYLTNVVGPLFDIDTEYEYEFVRSNYGRLRAEIARYYADHGLSAGS